MKRTAKWILIGLVGTLAVSALAQVKPVRKERRPAATKEASSALQTPPDYEFFSILNGLPTLLTLHHDTEVGTNRPIDVYVFVIEMQMMNSDGNLEPEGLQIFNYYTAKPQDVNRDLNPLNSRDCKLWNAIVLGELRNRDPKSKTWPYIQFMTAQGARVIQTNEDGPVWFSDDIQCWGSRDRFPPF